MADTPFKRLTETSVQVSVNAQSSLWFAWAPEEYGGPYKEKGELYTLLKCL